eukprot:4134563-Pleurochrysis_carterae.AAC.1
MPSRSSQPATVRRQRSTPMLGARRDCERHARPSDARTRARTHATVRAHVATCTRTFVSTRARSTHTHA